MFPYSKTKFVEDKNIRYLETHQTATGFIFNEDFSKILLIHHTKLNKWLGPGGHVDEGEMPHQALTRELKEEVNLSGQFLIYPKLRVLLDHEKEWMIPSPYITMLQLIPAYKDKPEHYHYDYGYLMVTKERSLSKNIRELKDAGWFDFTQIKSLDTFNIIQAVCSEIMKR